MNTKLIFPAVSFALLLIMGVYFLINPSYEKSLRAKYYYEVGDYKEALTLAKEAFSIDVYNRMASTIMAQSLTSLKYTSYLDDAKKYMTQINEIATHEFISDADKSKIRLICGIMISQYVKLAPSVVTDKDLVKESAEYNEKFEKLLEKIDKQI
jgi:tetratricopeptide (TPR) repeat protein